MKIVFATTLLFATLVLVHADVTSPPTPPSTNENAQTQIELELPDVTTVKILPSATDPAIKKYDFPHSVYLNRDIVVEHKKGLADDRHELLLWITGTHMKGTPYGNGAAAFCTVAADLGYHVVSLTYPNDDAAAQFRESIDQNAFEKFRMAVIQGGHIKTITIERTDSIENRLIKLLLHLKTIRAKENWGQFLNDDDTIKWETVAVAGQSQGGGHAALIGVKHRVARVICTGSPKDYNQRWNRPAAWYGEESATPKDRFFTFNHRQDSMGFTTPKQLLKNLQALGLDAFGPPADVDTEAFPYHHLRILTTGYPAVTVTGEQSEGSLTAHVSVIASKYADRWKQVWTYMLTDTAP